MEDQANPAASGSKPQRPRRVRERRDARQFNLRGELYRISGSTSRASMDQCDDRANLVAEVGWI